MGISPQYTWGEFVEYFNKDDLVQYFKKAPTDNNNSIIGIAGEDLLPGQMVYTQVQPGGNVFLYRSKDPSVPMEIQEKQPEEKNIVLKRALEF